MAMLIKGVLKSVGGSLRNAFRFGSREGGKVAFLCDGLSQFFFSLKGAFGTHGLSIRRKLLLLDSLYNGCI